MYKMTGNFHLQPYGNYSFHYTDFRETYTYSNQLQHWNSPREV